MSSTEEPVSAPLRFLQLLQERTNFRLPDVIREPVLTALADPATALDMVNQVILFASYSQGYPSVGTVQFVDGKLLYRSGNNHALVHGVEVYTADRGFVIRQLTVLDGGVPCWIESTPHGDSLSCVVIAGKLASKDYRLCTLTHLCALGSLPCYKVEHVGGDERDAFVVQGEVEGTHYRWIEHLTVVNGKPLYVGYSMGATRTSELVWGTDVLASGRWIGRPIPYRDGFLVEIHHEESEKLVHSIQYFSTNETYDVASTRYVKSPMILKRDGNELVVYAGSNVPHGRFAILYDNIPMMVGQLDYWDTMGLYDGQLFLYSLDDGSGMKTYVNLKPICDGCCISNSPSFDRRTGILELRIGRGDVGDKRSFNLYELGILTPPTS